MAGSLLIPLMAFQSSGLCSKAGSPLGQRKLHPGMRGFYGDSQSGPGPGLPPTTPPASPDASLINKVL